ncbi:hypothetical protein CCP4SC76_5290008 [Gammaproteobacteria bacterium]
MGILMSVLVPNAQALEKVSLQLNERPQFIFAGYYAAQMMGFYQAAGLDVTFLGSRDAGHR